MHVHLCVSVHMHMCMHTCSEGGICHGSCGNQRITRESWFSPSTTWVLGTKQLRLSSEVAITFTPLSHLANPRESVLILDHVEVPFLSQFSELQDP